MKQNKTWNEKRECAKTFYEMKTSHIEIFFLFVTSQNNNNNSCACVCVCCKVIDERTNESTSTIKYCLMIIHDWVGEG